MFGQQIRLFDLFGFEIKIDLSWVVLALLVTWTLATGYFPTTYADATPLTYWKMGVAGAFGLFASIIFHELCHSLVARRYGMRISGITLFIFGGVAEMQDQPPSPKAEFLMAAAGPASSYLLAGLLLLVNVGLGMGDLGSSAQEVIGYLALINIVLATFNLIPAFPLDGGRVYRAWMWHRTGNMKAATLKAAQTGGIFGLVLIFYGVYSLITGNLVGGLWLGLIGLFLRGAARQSIVQMESQFLMQDQPVSRFMSGNPDTVTPDITLDQLVEEHIYRHYHEFFPVVDHGGRLLGNIGVIQLRKIPRDKWAGLTVGEAMTPDTAANSVRADDDVMDVLRAMQSRGQSRLCVSDQQGQLVGIITLKDIMHLIALKMEIEGG